MAAEDQEGGDCRAPHCRRGVAQVRQEGLEEVFDFVVVGEVAEGGHDLLEGRCEGLQKGLLCAARHPRHVWQQVLDICSPFLRSEEAQAQDIRRV